MFDVRLLGKFEVKRDGKLVTIPSRSAQTLFAYLVLTVGTAHRREKLAGMLWPDSTEESARDYLRHSLWKIRKAIGPVTSKSKPDLYIIADDIHISFNSDSKFSLDVKTIKDVNENASTKELTNALSLYEGELLPGFYDDWVLLEREHLQAVYEQKMARLMALLQDEGHWLDILKAGERWISFGQKPEPAYRALMMAHAAKGDMSKVAATYERCIKSLKEFGVEPSEQTVKLYEQLKAGQGVQAASPLKEQKRVEASKEVDRLLNLPVPLTSFIGREQELKDIAKLLSSSRLLTLTGSGGVGKTRLAIQTANDFIKKFKDGVFWVSLVGLFDPALIPQEIAQSLNVRETSQEPLINTLKNNLKSKDILLVLDNCEHVIRDCAQYAEQLLASCPKLKILATSIEGLGLFNETVWQVPSLPLPEMKHPLSLMELKEFSSITLFDERARNARPDFSLDEKNAGFVTQICQRLDGIPLAIELAAARIKVLSVEEIALRLDDRFSLLTAGSRTAIPRHQTLRATIDWSHDLLTEPEQTLFRRLAVFVSGFTLEAAESVCSQGLKRNDILDLVGRLADKSLAVVERASTMGETRYRLLETIRQYALEKLIGAGEAHAIRDGHAEFYLTLAEESEPMIFSNESAQWFRRLDKELDNLRAAMEWSTNSGKADMALRIAGSIVYFWFAHGLLASEWHDRIEQALLRPEGKERTLARAKALNGIGFMYWADVYPTDKRQELEEALGIGRELGDQWNIATALRNLGLLENIKGNYPEARSFLEQSLVIWREMGIEGKTASAWTLGFLGDVGLNQGEAEWARSLYEEAVTILREPGDINFLAYSVRRLGHILWREGEYIRAIALCKESLNLNLEVGDPRGTVACLAGFADIALAQGKLKRAAQLMAAVETQLTLIGIRLLHMDKKEYGRNLALLRDQLDEVALSKLWAKGKSMTLEQAIVYALAEK